MELDLDKTMAGILQWDFSIKHAGRSVAVRPLTLADLGTLASAGKAGVVNAELLAGVFAEPADTVLPWLGAFGPEDLLASVLAITEYVKSVLSKNYKAIASTVVKAMAPPSDPSSGSSTLR